jgi:anaerobic selenocysteine-containing dehydrogenase
MTVIDSAHLLPERLALHHLHATTRSHHRYNTTFYSRSDGYRSVFRQRDVVFVNQRELERRSLRPGEHVDIAVLRGSMSRASGCASCKSSA